LPRRGEFGSQNSYFHIDSNQRGFEKGVVFANFEIRNPLRELGKGFPNGVLVEQLPDEGGMLALIEGSFAKYEELFLQGNKPLAIYDKGRYVRII
jgi:hypothetical protein